MSPEVNKAIVREYLQDVWNRGNMDAIDRVISADYIQHIAGVSPGRDGVKQFFQVIRTAFPDIRIDVHEMIAEGDMVAWHFANVGTHTGPFRGIPPTGKQVRVNGFALVRMQDGQFVEAWGEQDNLGLMMQLGALPPPKPK